MAGPIELTLPAGGSSGSYVCYTDLELRSVLQPILGILSGRVVGFEALLRPSDRGGASIPPSILFDSIKDHDELVALNKIVLELHIANFCALDPGNCWIFLNISVSVLRDLVEGDEGLPAMLVRHNVAATRVVIEVLESDIADVDDVWNALIQYRRAGLMVGFDDFGSGHSNLARIFNFVPDIVKFDLSVMAQARRNPSLLGTYEHLTALLHNVGALVLAEGIESLEDALFMMNANVDCLQGYWISRPACSTTVEHIADKLKLLRHAYSESADASDELRNHLRAEAEAALMRSAICYRVTGDLPAAAALFFAVECSARFYILDEDGLDIGSLPRESAADARVREKLAPLQPTGSSGFIHRSYFRDALRCPNKIHFGGPYFSFLDGGSVYVVATGRRAKGKRIILCGSLRTHDQMSEPAASEAARPGLESHSH